MRSLLDPRLRTAIPEHWPSLCTIQTITYTANAANQLMPTGVTNVSGMVNLQCRLGPIILSRPTDDEIRDTKVQEKYSRRNLKINAYLPQIQVRAMQAVVDGIVYPIRGVEGDSQQFSTRLRLEIVKP